MRLRTTAALEEAPRPKEPGANLTKQGLPNLDILCKGRGAFQRTKLDVVRHKARRTLLVTKFPWRIR